VGVTWEGRMEFYTVLVDGVRDDETLFVNFEDAERWVEKASSWDCRPQGGDYSEWYDPRSGTTYKIVDCDDCGRF